MNQSTSTQTYIPSSASAQPNLQQAVTQMSQTPLPVSVPSTNSGSNDYWVKEWIIPVVGMLLAGVASYFFTLMAVKEKIAENSQAISLVQNDVKHIEERLKDIKSDLNDFGNFKSDVLVLKTSMSNLEYNQRNNQKK